MLATNAMAHAHAPFVVRLSRAASSVAPWKMSVVGAALRHVFRTEWSHYVVRASLHNRANELIA